MRSAEHALPVARLLEKGDRSEHGNLRQALLQEELCHRSYRNSHLTRPLRCGRLSKYQESDKGGPGRPSKLFLCESTSFWSSFPSRTSNGSTLNSSCSVSKKKDIRIIRESRFSRQLVLPDVEVSFTRLERTRSTTLGHRHRAAATPLSSTLLSIISHRWKKNYWMISLDNRTTTNLTGRSFITSTSSS